VRPPFAQELKTAWHDGTRGLVFEPLEFLERLAAITLRPETNLLICHGVLAPRACWRARMLAYGRVLPEVALAPAPDGEREQTTPRAWTWAALMHRGFGIGAGAQRMPLCLRRGTAFAAIRPVLRPIDGKGMSGLACCAPRPGRAIREEAAHGHCGIGSWGGQRVSMGDYVAASAPRGSATAAGGG